MMIIMNGWYAFDGDDHDDDDDDGDNHHHYLAHLSTASSRSFSSFSLFATSNAFRFFAFSPAWRAWSNNDFYDVKTLPPCGTRGHWPKLPNTTSRIFDGNDIDEDEDHMNTKIMILTWLALWKASKLPAMMGMGRERTSTPDNLDQILLHFQMTKRRTWTQRWIILLFNLFNLIWSVLCRNIQFGVFRAYSKLWCFYYVLGNISY